MAIPSVLLIGCGRMGRGIAQMLLMEQNRQRFPFELWIFDPYLPAETQCQQDVSNSHIPGALRSLREVFSKSENEVTSDLQIRDKGADFRKTSNLVSKAVQQIDPRLILNAATYMAHEMYIPLARELGCDYLDLGQNLPPLQELATIDATIAKKEEGTRIIQENGLAPGLVNILAVSMYHKAQSQNRGTKIHSVQMRVGGLPQHTTKGGKLHYGPTFSPEGLLFEYENIAYGLRNGQLVTPTTFTQPEYWESPSDTPQPYGITPFSITDPTLKAILIDRVESQFRQTTNNELMLKNLEARPTADGTSRMCFEYRFQSTVSHLEYKTLRFAPHYDTWKELQQKGRLASTLADWRQNMNDPTISGYPDLVLLRVWAQTTATSPPDTVELVALHDDVPVGSPMGLTAMQHLTGWPTVLLALVLLQLPPKTRLSSQPELFLESESKTAFDRTIQQVLQTGGIIAPFELIDGIKLLEEINQQNRIPLIQTRITNNKKD